MASKDSNKGKKKEVKKETGLGQGKKKEVEKETDLSLSYKKDENFGEWYPEVVVNGEMISTTTYPAVIFYAPWAMSIWEILQVFFDAEIKKMKIKNSYFSLFVSPAVLQKEKDHVEGIAPEGVVSFFGK
ncbi:proline--tRNA ligase, cytoplasmic-like [Nicotiana tomentosiformis]|uniref:proline--tRNA ligase, cytoplasmic-like n=1 Tax=Nicotiana tomentosiformis TaxID=4098 RepID=UPI00388C8F45